MPTQNQRLSENQEPEPPHTSPRLWKHVPSGEHADEVSKSRTWGTAPWGRVSWDLSVSIPGTCAEHLSGLAMPSLPVTNASSRNLVQNRQTRHNWCVPTPFIRSVETSDLEKIANHRIFLSLSLDFRKLIHASTNRLEKQDVGHRLRSSPGATAKRAIRPVVVSHPFPRASTGPRANLCSIFTCLKLLIRSSTPFDAGFASSPMSVSGILRVGLAPCSGLRTLSLCRNSCSGCSGFESVGPRFPEFAGSSPPDPIPGAVQFRFPECHCPSGGWTARAVHSTGSSVRAELDLGRSGSLANRSVVSISSRWHGPCGPTAGPCCSFGNSFASRGAEHAGRHSSQLRRNDRGVRLRQLLQDP